MSRAAEILKKRKYQRRKIEIHLSVTGADINVLKAALKSYAESSAKSEKRIALDMLELIEFQENKQSKGGEKV